MQRSDMAGAPPPDQFIEISNPTDRERQALVAPPPALKRPRAPAFWPDQSEIDTADGDVTMM